MEIVCIVGSKENLSKCHIKIVCIVGSKKNSSKCHMEIVCIVGKLLKFKLVSLG